MGLMVTGGKVACSCFGSSLLFIRGPALGLLVLHRARGREWVCRAARGLPSAFVWSVFCPDDVQQSTGPGCCLRLCVGEKGYERLLFPSSRDYQARAQHLPEAGRTPSPGPQESFPGFCVAVACSPPLEWCRKRGLSWVRTGMALGP